MSGSGVQRHACKVNWQTGDSYWLTDCRPVPGSRFKLFMSFLQCLGVKYCFSWNSWEEVRGASQTVQAVEDLHSLREEAVAEPGGGGPDAPVSPV